MSVVVLVTHEVKEFSSWKKGFDAHSTAREAAGFKVKFLARDAKRPNVVHLGFEAPTMAAVEKFLNDPGLKTAMEKGGVIGAPEIRLGNAA